jgi:hypothetical protein
MDHVNKNVSSAVRVLSASEAPPSTARLHMIKLSVGTESVDGLAEWQGGRMAERLRLGIDPRPRHVTRMTPRRGDELVPGGSIYWVIQGRIQARQPLAELEPVTGQDGIKRCALILEPVLYRTEHRPKRPFQGWRYLKVEDAPADTDLRPDMLDDMPDEMREELQRMGLL